MKYNHQKIETEIQKFWKENKTFETVIDSKKAKYYILDMFPYPSGEGLHVGHVKGYSASDVIAHYMRLKGYNVLHPMGWDAFGLPAENYAIKINKNPNEVVKTNIDKFKNQLESLGYSYDWSREINTADPEYYKWTQWIFLQLLVKGLAYQDEIPINFCPSCKTGLANEEVSNGQCERCHSNVTRKKLKQWILRITKYTERLLEDLEELDWPEPIKEMQRNWIGRSEGVIVNFKVVNSKEVIQVYTTRIDTIFSGTFLILAPENNLVDKLTDEDHKQEVQEYVDNSSKKSELERIENAKNKDGVFTGSYAINPATRDKMPVWISDFVLPSYGTGSVFADAHDQRDFDMAKKYDLPLKVSIKPKDGKNWDEIEKLELCFSGDGVLVNSDQFSGLMSSEARGKIGAWLEEKKLGKRSVQYKLRDWVFSRQRYWGEPIPVVHCEKCGIVPLAKRDLPLELPFVESYESTGDGESPLAKIEDWVNTKCPNCSGPAKRETDTMPNWAGSCWYYLRFADSTNTDKLISHESEKYYLPVDFYIGGAEHAVLHLLYARFWHKFLHDIGLVKDREPFKKLKNVGLILGPDNQKMSKSRGNVINPDDLVEKYGADALRMYELFIGPFDQSAVWNTNGIIGTRKFLEKVVANFNPTQTDSDADLGSLTYLISDKIEKNMFNTAVSGFMKFANETSLSKMSKAQWKLFLTILAPFAPHLCEFLFMKLTSKSVFAQKWPDIKVAEKTTLYVIQINGKKKGILQSSGDDKSVIRLASEIPNVTELLGKKTVKKTIFVKNKIVNFVI